MKWSEFVYAALAAGLAGVCAVGCAARSATTAPVTARTVPPPDRPSVDRDSPAPTTGPAAVGEAADGVTHIVGPGQTLWRIAHVYGVDVETLRASNGIEDPSRLAEGSALRIPGASAVLDVPPYPAPLPEAHAPPHDVRTELVLEAGTWIWPVPGGEVLGRFGDVRRAHRHAGLDIVARHGQPVVAARAGRVSYSGSKLRGYGKTVVIDHGDGTSSLYGHNSELLVHVGDEVVAAQVIARVGNTGNATTDHCHFEVRRDDRPIDPWPLFASADGTR